MTRPTDDGLYQETLPRNLARPSSQQARDLELPNDCVLHSLRHTFLTRFGEAGADAFTIKKVAGHSSVTISERYIHPTPEGQERAFERFATLNKEPVEKAEKDEESLQFPLKFEGNRS